MEKYRTLSETLNIKIGYQNLSVRNLNFGKGYSNLFVGLKVLSHGGGLSWIILEKCWWCLLHRIEASRALLRWFLVHQFGGSRKRSEASDFQNS